MKRSFFVALLLGLVVALISTSTGSSGGTAHAQKDEGATPPLSIQLGEFPAQTTPDSVAHLAKPDTISVQPGAQAPPDAPTATPIKNGGFESGAQNWTEYSAHGWPVILHRNDLQGLPPHSGNWAAWLGGGHDEIAYIQQNNIKVPGVNQDPVLLFWLWIASEDVCGYDFFYIVVNTSTVRIDLCQRDNTGGWVPALVDLSAFANKTVSLQFGVETDSGGLSSIFLDDVGFRATVYRVFLPTVQRRFFNDPYEPNNVFGQAWGPLVSGATYRAYFPTASDNNDYYHFTMPAAHSVEISLTHIPAGNDYDLYLYNNAQVYVKHSGTVGTANEKVTVASLAAGRYYVRVTRESGTSKQPYHLRAVYR